MLHEISPTSFGPKLAELWQSQNFAKSQKTFFKILKFQLLVLLDYQMRCSIKLVRLHLDLNWQSYGNPKILKNLKKKLFQNIEISTDGILRLSNDIFHE